MDPRDHFGIVWVNFGKILVFEFAFHGRAMVLDQEITKMLNAWRQGDKEAEAALMEVVRDKLKAIAVNNLGRQDKRRLNLDPTELLHELYIQLVGNQPDHWKDRGQFFGFAARLVRNVLVDEARKKLAKKRGGGQREHTLDSQNQPMQRVDNLLMLDEALSELEKSDPRKYRVVELFHFGGLSQEEVGQYLEISVPTVKREWQRAQAWLQNYLRDQAPDQRCDSKA